MSSASLPVLGFCLLVLFLNIPSSQAVSPVPSCCLKTHDTKVPLKRLVEYHKQDAVCGVKAVQIRTDRGHTICSDPSSQWAQRAMRYLDGKKATKAAMIFPATRTSST
ncbi:C-C motif chemokine 13-like isoform X2 [Brienomyrus brachyistius]|uniref:C-C motif chemokine 13-like isoform X2 n=1 Tax=Brienomyrus brachyistius TaxID=42636 RepID=UPI0020B31D3D|nr:C-C motif chemokine 13-like isoform X2 [Brienomyrus brachyistius]